MKKGLLIGTVVFAAVVAWASSGRAKAASSGPTNMRQADGKFAAIALGAELVAGGTWVIVATDAAHRSEILEVVRRRAAAHPQWKFVVFDMDLARQLAAERAEVEIPADAWGGVAAVKGGELLQHAFFPATDAIPDAENRIGFVEKNVPALGAGPGSSAPSVVAGLLVDAPEVGSGPSAPPDVGSGPTPSPASRPAGARERLWRFLRKR